MFSSWNTFTLCTFILCVEASLTIEPLEEDDDRSGVYFDERTKVVKFGRGQLRIFLFIRGIHLPSKSKWKKIMKSFPVKLLKNFIYLITDERRRLAMTVCFCTYISPYLAKTFVRFWKIYDFHKQPTCNSLTSPHYMYVQFYSFMRQRNWQDLVPIQKNKLYIPTQTHIILLHKTV